MSNIVKDNKDGTETHVYERKNHRTEFDKTEVLKIVGGVRNAIRLGLVTPNNNQIKKYFEDNPEDKETYDAMVQREHGRWNDKGHSAPWLATKKKKQ